MQSILQMMSQNRHEPNDKVEKNNNLLNREKNELIPRSKLLMQSILQMMSQNRHEPNDKVEK